MKKLPTRQAAVLNALLQGLSQAEAAQQARVSERTVRRYLAGPAFILALREAQDMALAGTVRRMNAGANEALDTLRDVMRDKTIAPGTRVRAALGWLAELWRAKELSELAERVAALEQRIEGNHEPEDTNQSSGEVCRSADAGRCTGDDARP